MDFGCDNVGDLDIDDVDYDQANVDEKPQSFGGASVGEGSSGATASNTRNGAERELLSITTDQAGRLPIVGRHFTKSGDDDERGLMELLKMQMDQDNQRRLDEHRERTERQRSLEEEREENSERDERRHGQMIQFFLLTFGRKTD